MDADLAAPATPGLDPWAACEERAVVHLTLADGQVLTGHYTAVSACTSSTAPAATCR